MSGNNGSTGKLERPQRVIAIEASNYRKLVLVDITLDTDDYFHVIGGSNDQGKSTLIDLILDACCGADWVPDEPIRQGQDAGSFTVTLTDYILTVAYERDRPRRLTIEMRTTGATVKKPATWLKENGIGISLSFDGLAFARFGATKEGTREQARILRDLIDLDTATLDGERDKIYAERTHVNRQVTQLEAKFAGMPSADDLPDVPAEIDMTKFFNELESATKVKAANDRLRQTTQLLFDKLGEKRRAYELLAKEIAGLVAEHTASLATTSALVDPDIEPIRKEAENAKTHNATVAAAKSQRDAGLRAINDRDVCEAELRGAEKVTSHLTSRIGEIDAEKAKMLAAAKDRLQKLVPGLALDADGSAVMFNGKPYSQAATSQQIKVGLAISAALNPGVRATTIKDGSLLDAASLAAVRQFAREAKIDVFVERVGVDDENVIVIEDGRVRQTATPAPAIA